MEITPSISIARLGILLLFSYVVYTLAGRISLWWRARQFHKTKGTMPIQRLRQFDTIFGLDAFVDTIRAVKQHHVLETVRKRYTSHGAQTLQWRSFGHDVYSTIEPENLKTIQAIDFKKWGLPNARKSSFHPLLGRGIFTTDGAEWQHSRDMLRPNFVRTQVGDISMFERHMKHLIAAIPRDNSTIDLSDLFFRLTIDSATELLFGESTSSLTSSSNSHFSSAFSNSQEQVLYRARWGNLAKIISPDKDFNSNVAFVHAFVDSYVTKALSRHSSSPKSPSSAPSTSSRYIFIDELVRQTSDPIVIRSELLNILLAGRDTTASLLTNVFWTLARNPAIWDTLQHEIATNLDPSVLPTFESLKSLKYLRAVLNESLRLYPVVPLNSREAREDTTLPVGGGPDGRAPIFVPKGQRVSWSAYAMHRRKDLYGEDADEFRPERWIDEDDEGSDASGTGKKIKKKGLRPGWEYLPFNGGARVCLGQQYALTEASYAVVRLCQAFKGIESRDDRPWTEMMTLTCVNRYGAIVGLTPREG